MTKSNHFDVQLIKENLYEADFGDLVTFSQLSALLGKDVQGEHYHILYRALREMEEEGYVFENIRNIGYRRLSDEERAMCGRIMVSIRRKTDRGITRKSLGIDYDGLSPEAKIKQNVHLTILNMTRTVISKKSMDLIENKLDRLGDKIESIEKMLGVFK